jgi:hypothetical protein
MPTLKEMRAEEDGWWTGYHDGQRDVLTWLSGEFPDDVPMAPIAAGLEAAYAMMCLGHNLAMVGALCAAHLIGEKTSRDIYWHAHGWRPNTDGKAAP